MSIIKEFKEFAVKGNVLDLAIGIIIGAAFGNIVKSLVDGVFMPILGMLIGNIDISQLFVNISTESYATAAQATAAGVPVIKYGLFLQSVIDFTIVAFAIFLMVKAINTAKRKEANSTSAPSPTPEDIVLLREIRDSLKK